MKLSSNSPLTLTLAALIVALSVPLSCLTFWIAGQPTFCGLLALLSGMFGLAVMVIDDVTQAA